MKRTKATQDKNKKEMDIIEYIVKCLPLEIQEDAMMVLKDLSRYFYNGEPPIDYFRKMLIKHLIKKNLKGE